MKIKICPTGALGWGNGQFNYCAYDDNSYDGLGSLIGYGRTSELAKEDLLLQIADSKLGLYGTI